MKNVTAEELAAQYRKEYYREYRARNKDKFNEYSKQWRAEHPDKVKQYNETYWMKKAKEAFSNSDQC